MDDVTAEVPKWATMATGIVAASIDMVTPMQTVVVIVRITMTIDAIAAMTVPTDIGHGGLHIGELWPMH